VSESDDCCGSVLLNSCCSKLVAEASEQFENPEEGEYVPLKANTRKLVKTKQAENICVL
jgi:hypothetical protein